MPDADRYRLVAELRAAVRECGLSHSELARRAGISQPQISRFMADPGEDEKEYLLSLLNAAVLFDYFGLVVSRPDPFPPVPPPPASRTTAKKPRKR